MNTSRGHENRDWSELIEVLNANDSFIFSTHVEPDADGLGSELALARVLSGMGKTVHILNPTDIRSNLDFLPKSGEVEVYSTKQHAAVLDKTQVFIAFDVGHYNRLNSLGEDLLASEVLKLSVDHHPGDKSQFDQIFDYPDVSSTGVLIYGLLKQLDSSYISDIEVAKPLYAAMMSDTGNFRFNNTDPETLHAAADLVAVGVKPYELYVNIYENLNTPGRLLVLQELLNTIQYDCEGQLAWAVIDLDELSHQGVVPDDLHSLSDFIRSVRGVEVGAAITKLPGKAVDVSLRSKGKYAINGVAKQFGGGGHAFAAGCSLDEPLEEATKKLVAACREVITNGSAG